MTVSPAHPDSDSKRARACLRLWLTPGLGLATCQRVLAQVQNPVDVFALKAAELKRLSLRPEAIADLRSSASLERAEKEWTQAAALGIRIIDLKDPRYPPLLKEVFDPPIVLYLREEGWDPTEPHVSIVGTRRPSLYGLRSAERLGAELADLGIVVVSGLARGIDTAAHRGALSTGRTVAVLGTGLDRTYPAENRKLADSIADKGALLSEFPLRTAALPRNFPQRNRILAGMTLGTIVVEAKQRSGSLITARLAADANREVFAVPGPIDSPRSAGPHHLIRQGACLITESQDVVAELPAAVRERLTVSRKLAPAGPPTPGTSELAPAQRMVLGALSASEATPIDRLLTEVRLPSSEIFSALLDLELGGWVRRHSGDCYSRSPLTEKKT